MPKKKRDAIPFDSMVTVFQRRVFEILKNLSSEIFHHACAESFEAVPLNMHQAALDTGFHLVKFALEAWSLKSFSQRPILYE